MNTHTSLAENQNQDTTMLQPNWDDPLKSALPAQAPVAKIAPVDVSGETAEEETLQALPPVRMEDKRVVNGEADVNQLAPFKYPWAWEFFLNANKNHWTPLDVNMSQDVADYHH